MTGKFITFEGIDGAGKSSHVEWLKMMLIDHGVNVKVTREPGGTEIGEKIRKLVLNDPMQLKTETLLVFASRAEHLETLIKPRLLKGDWVISDRFSDSTYAFQCGGRGLDKGLFHAMETIVCDGVQPDLTFLFDVPTEVAAARLARDGRQLDRFEQEERDFHRRVRDAYIERALYVASRIIVIDSTQSIDQIRQEMTAIMEERFFTTK